MRHFVSSPWAAAIGCIFVLLGTSLEGTDRIWVHWTRGIPFDALRNTNIDAVTDWNYQGMRADGLHRLLFYQPQHQTGYLLGLSAVIALYQARDVARPAVFLLIGAFLAACMLFSTVSFLMLIGMCAAYAAWRISRGGIGEPSCLARRRRRADDRGAAPHLRSRLRRCRRTAADVRREPEIHAPDPVGHVPQLRPGDHRRRRRDGLCPASPGDGGVHPLWFYWRCAACSTSWSIFRIHQTASAGMRPRSA